MKLERERAKLEGRLKREAEKQRKEQERKEKKLVMCKDSCGIIASSKVPC